MAFHTIFSGYRQSPPDSIASLWYYANINRFTDDNGIVVQDLSNYFPTWQLDAWKKTKDYGILIDKNGNTWEVFYIDICGHNCKTCHSKCEIYEFIKDSSEDIWARYNYI